MAVTFHNATQTAGPASVGTKTILHTLSAADCCVLVWTTCNAATSISAMAANGIAFTRLGQVSAGSSRSELWGLSAFPGSATLSLSINTVAASLDFCVVVTSYVGQRTVGGSPFGTFQQGTAVGTSANLSISSTTTDVVAFGFALSGASSLALNNGNTRASSTATTAARLVVGDITGDLVISVSAVAGASNQLAMFGVPLVASATPTTTIAFDNANSTASSGAVSHMGLTLTATTGAVLLVWTNTDNGTTISAVHIGSTQLTFLGTTTYGTLNNRAELWGTTAPGSGVLAISVETVAAGTTGLGVAGATYVGCKTTATPFGGIGTATSTTVNIAVSVSSTAGNVVVAGFVTRMFNPVSVSSWAGTVARTPKEAYPNVLIADTIGAPASTATVKLAAAADQGAIGINLIQSGAASFVSGAAAFTDVRDVFSASGQVIVTGRLSATDVADKFSASGQVIVQGSIAFTQVADKFSASAFNIVSGRLSATDAGHDTFSASGYNVISGRLSATDTRDIFSASGYVIVTGRLSATEAADRLSVSGYTVISGRLSATDVTDRLSASGQVIISARLSATDAHDIFSASGYVTAAANLSIGRLSATEAADIFSASGNVIVSAQLSATDVTDRFSASGYVVVTARLSATDAPDTFLALGSGVTLVAPVVDRGESGGGTRGKPPYIRADDSFWDARQKYLESIHRHIVSEPEATAPLVSMEVPAYVGVVDPAILTGLRIQRTTIIEALPAVTTMRHLKAHGNRLQKLNQQIADEKLKQAQYQAQLEAIAKKQRKAAFIKRRRKRVLLAAAAVASALRILQEHKPR